LSKEGVNPRKCDDNNPRVGKKVGSKKNAKMSASGVHKCGKKDFGDKIDL